MKVLKYYAIHLFGFVLYLVDILVIWLTKFESSMLICIKTFSKFNNEAGKVHVFGLCVSD